VRAVLAAADPVGQRNAGNVFKGGGTARAEGRGSEPEGLEALQARRDELAELLDLLRRRQASLVSP
jgi:hypothetical protein